MITHFFYDHNGQLSGSMQPPDGQDALDAVEVVLVSGDVQKFYHYDGVDRIGIAFRGDGGISVVNDNGTVLRAFGSAAWAWINGDQIA